MKRKHSVFGEKRGTEGEKKGKTERERELKNVKGEMTGREI
jgi:hypothetical protein